MNFSSTLVTYWYWNLSFRTEVMQCLFVWFHLRRDLGLWIDAVFWFEGKQAKRLAAFETGKHRYLLYPCSKVDSFVRMTPRVVALKRSSVRCMVWDPVWTSLWFVKSPWAFKKRRATQKTIERSACCTVPVIQKRFEISCPGLDRLLGYNAWT